VVAAPHAAEAPRDAAGLVAVPPLARVTDLAGALKPADVQALEAKLAAYEMAKGSQIAIIVLPTTQPEPIADFAQRVGDAWKIGRKGVGDGVLITVAIQDRRVWISVARALEGALPDVVATRISREVIAPRFREGDYGGGLLAGLDAILRRLDGEALPPPVAAARRPGRCRWRRGADPAGRRARRHRRRLGAATHVRCAGCAGGRRRLGLCHQRTADLRPAGRVAGLVVFVGSLMAEAVAAAADACWVAGAAVARRSSFRAAGAAAAAVADGAAAVAGPPAAAATLPAVAAAAVGEPMKIARWFRHWFTTPWR
jgi:uncharacterized membrane protein YgcG